MKRHEHEPKSKGAVAAGVAGVLCMTKLFFDIQGKPIPYINRDALPVPYVTSLLGMASSAAFMARYSLFRDPSRQVGNNHKQSRRIATAIAVGLSALTGLSYRAFEAPTLGHRDPVEVASEPPLPTNTETTILANAEELLDLVTETGECTEHIQFGETTDSNKRIQQALAALGYYPATAIDGQWGPVSSASLELFRVDNAIEKVRGGSGMIDDTTCQALAQALEEIPVTTAG